MGLFSSRNLRKAKSMLDENRHKVGDLVDKATDQLDKVSKGRTSSVSKKIDDAAHQYSTGATTHHGDHPGDEPASAGPTTDEPGSDDDPSRPAGED